MPDLHDAFRSVAERHPATDAASTSVHRRAVVRRRRRTALVVTAMVAVVLLCAGSALALQRSPVMEVDVAGTAPATDAPATSEPPGTTSTTFAPDDLRSVLPTPARPVHVQISGTAMVEGDGPVELCAGILYLSRPPQCTGPVLGGVTAADVRALDGVDEAFVRNTVVRWAKTSVAGWFDGATITLDGSMGPWSGGTGAGPTFTAGGPELSSTPEQRMAVMDDLMAAGITSWGSISSGGHGAGLAIEVPWADQALVELLATRHPGIVITLIPAMTPI